MSRAVASPDRVKSELQRLAAEGRFVRAIEILPRGGTGELVLASTQEAPVVVDVARVARRRRRCATRSGTRTTRGTTRLTKTRSTRSCRACSRRP